MRHWVNNYVYKQIWLVENYLIWVATNSLGIKSNKLMLNKVNIIYVNQNTTSCI